MAEKELPPLYVRILGDNSGFKKTLQDTIDAAAKAEAKKVKAVAKEGERDAKDRWKGLQMFLKYEEQKAKSRWKGVQMFLKYEEQKTNATRAAYTKRLKFNSKVMEDLRKAAEREVKDRWRGLQMYLKYEEQKRRESERTAKQEAKDRWRGHQQYLKYEEQKRREAEKTAKAAQRAYIKQLKFNSKVMEDQRKAEEKRVKDLEKWMEKSAKDVQKYQERQRKQAQQDYLKKLKFNSRVMEDQRRAQEKAAKEQERNEERRRKESQRRRMEMARQVANFQRSLESRKATRPDMGFGLGARADIYMHMNALRNLTQSGRGILELAGNYEIASIGIEAFTGSATKAASVMQAIQDYAIASPYQTVQLADMARNMMSYGIAADDAMATLKGLGDVAGGSGLRLERLSFAMSQITSMSRLQGQELRQLTEQGFNPLETISRHTGKSMLELKKIMEDGGIPANAVREALKVETSAGGRFAGMAARMQNSLPGLTNQIKELAQKLGLDLVKAVDDDLKNALRRAIEKLKEFNKFINTPEGKEAVKRFAAMAKNVLLAAMAFHALGLGVATLRWQIASLATIFSVLKGAMLPVYAVMNLMLTPLSLAASALQAFLTGSFMGFLGVAAGFAQMLIGVGAMGVAVAGVRDLVAGKGSLTQAFKDLPQHIQKASAFVNGFFYNIQSNWKILIEWFSANYKSVMEFVMGSANRVLSAIGNNILVIADFLGKAFEIGFKWLEIYLPPLIERLVSLIGNSIKKAVSSWMSAAWSKKAKEGFTGLEFLLPGSLQTWNETLGSVLPGYDAKAAEAQAATDRAARTEKAKQEGGNFDFAGGLAGPLAELINGLQHGFEKGGFLKGVKLPEFNLTIPEFKLPEVPKIELPEAYAPDFSDLGKGMSSLSKVQLLDTAVYDSADHARRIYEYSQNMEAIQAGLRGEPQKEGVDKQQLKALQGIEKNTRPAAAPAAANFSPS